MLTGYRRLAVRKRVLVNLDTGRAIRGVLMSQRGALLELRDPEVIEPGLNPRPASGTILIERARVEFIQTLGD
jgi:hypothetical protein